VKHRAATELERALGDPLDPRARVSFDALLEADEREEPPAAAFAALREWGFHAHLVPVECGGRLASFEELLALVRVISRRDLVLTTGLGSTLLAAIPVWIWGSDDQREWLAERLLEDGAFGCFAASERDAGSDFRATATVATPTGSGYTLQGEKWLIGNAGRCAYVVVLARCGRSLSLFFAHPADLAPGTFRRLPRIRTLGLRSHDLGGMAFEGCAIPETALLVPAGRGMEMALTALQFTRTMIGGMALGAADAALRIAVGWARRRTLYGRPILAIPAVRDLLLGGFLDILTAECVAVVAARALTLAPRRMSLWAAVAKYLVPHLCERATRDAASVLSARSYLREGVAGGAFQKVARDIAIASIFEGTDLVQLALIASQLRQLAAAGQLFAPGDDAGRAGVARLCSLAAPAPAWEPRATRLRIGDPGGDELVDGLLAEPSDGWPDCDHLVAGELRAHRAAMREEALALRAGLAARPGVEPELETARRYCLLHAAACCIEVWRHGREELAEEGAGGAWLALCLARLRRRLIGAPAAAPAGLAADVCAWMLREFEDGELFSIAPFALATATPEESRCGPRS
jgi:alkylation response protein AidB-like acyl-CoA dehydrogenase